MKVKLVSYSQAPKLEETENNPLHDMNIQELIAFSARVSNPTNQYNTETSDKLIKYLIKHKHFSPFEMVSACLEITTTRDIARQILRHRSFSFQEFCVSGDTEIYFAVPKKMKNGSYKPTQKFTIRELWDKWENGAEPLPNGHRMPMKDRIKNMMIKVYDEDSGKLTTSNIKEIFKTGKKDIFEITLSDGKKIKTTKEHKFLTKTGFVDLETAVGLSMVGNRATMTKSPMIGVNGELEYRNVVKWVSIDKIEYVGQEETYDIEVDHSSHNYIANGVVVHNSQRYADPTKDLDFEIREARLQDTKNRQNSIDLDNKDVNQLKLAYQWENIQRDLIDRIKSNYQWAIDHGIAKEQARAILPEGLTQSRMYMQGTIRSWIHYIEVRSANGTQKEHMEIARECAKALAPIFPMIQEFIGE